MSEISRKVLCVDDEINVLEGLRRQLRREFEVTIAELLTLIPDDSQGRPVPQYVFVSDKSTKRETDISELPHGPVERDPATGKIIKKDLRKHYPEYPNKFVPKIK